MRVLDLFSGIGGFSLGLERAGMRTVQFVELDPFCRAVLAKHWPHVPCHDDIRTFHAPAGSVDVICGGFPCQDISDAGEQAGIEGERSGLWAEYGRLIGEVRPRYAIVENVSALLHRGMGRVLGDLAALGYDAEWHGIPAAAIGAHHRRDRVWIVAYPGGQRQQQHGERDGWTKAGEPPPCGSDAGRRGASMADSDERRRFPGRVPGRQQEDEARPRSTAGGHGETLADAIRPRLAFWESFGSHDGEEQPTAIGSGWWPPEPDVGRVVDGFPGRVDQLHALGNAVVPQIPEIIGRAIMRAEHDR